MGLNSLQANIKKVQPEFSFFSFNWVDVNVRYGPHINCQKKPTQCPPATEKGTFPSLRVFQSPFPSPTFWLFAIPTHLLRWTNGISGGKSQLGVRPCSNWRHSSFRRRFLMSGTWFPLAWQYYLCPDEVFPFSFSYFSVKPLLPIACWKQLLTFF